jgi:hypothetical protein
MRHPTGFETTKSKSGRTTIQASKNQCLKSIVAACLASRHYTSVNPLSHQGDANVALVLRPKLHREALAVAADPEAARDKL